MMTEQIDSKNQYASLISAAEEVMAGHFGTQIHVTEVECLSEAERRNLLLRCTLAEPGNSLPPSVIVKQVVADEYKPDDITSWDTKRFFSDWVGAQFLSTLPNNPRHGPQFYGGHREQGFIILEDMGSDHRSLVEPLLQEDAESAQTALLKFSRRLGQMHADTIGQTGIFAEMAKALHPQLISPQQDIDEIEQKLPPLFAIFDSLDVERESNLEQELSSVLEAIQEPGPFRAYIHSDPCPDNIFYQGETLRLIDFEFGYVGHALVDITYGRMIMPTCWCCNRIPWPVVEAMESTYRAELAKGCPEAEDDPLFETALTNVCGYWLLNTLQWMLEQALEKDDEWGIAPIRPRILARLAAFIESAEKFDQLPAYRGTASRLLDALQKHWADVESLPVYPAFRA